jgi:hypothetical protein
MIADMFYLFAAGERDILQVTSTILDRNLHDLENPPARPAQQADRARASVEC